MNPGAHRSAWMRARGGAGVVLLTLLAGCASHRLWLPGSGADLWSQQGRGAGGTAWRAGGPEPPLALAWQTGLGHAPVGSALLAGPLIVQASTRSELVALERITGRRVGRHGFDRALIGSPVVWRDLVVAAVGEPGGELVALERRTGRVAWRCKGIFEAPLGVVDSLILAARIDGVLLALDAASGTVRTRVETGGRLWAGTCAAGAAAYVGVGGARGELVAVDLASGKIRWRTVLEGGGVRTRPLAAGGWVCAGTAGGTITAVDARSGDRRWSTTVGALPGCVMACAGGVVIVGTADRGLYGLDLSDGRRLWRCSTGGVIRGGPAATLHTAYCASMDGYLYAVEIATGRLEHRYHLDGPVATPVTVTRDRVIVVSERGTVYAFAAE